MELIVAEKPKVAEKIAYALCDDAKRNAQGGIAYYTGTVDGEKIAVAPAVGHVYTLMEKAKTKSYPAFDIDWVPAYKAESGAAYTKAYVSLLESLGEEADVFTAACDYDIEGSLIGYNVFRFAYGKKEGRRMKFSTLTKADLLEAYRERGEMDYNNAFAGEARHVLDWYYGINLSRALMSALRAAHRFRVMSIGRVQGPALGLLAKLELDIRAFVPTPYWEVTANIKGVEFMHAGKRFTDEEEAAAALDGTGKEGAVEKAEKKEQTVAPNPPFDLTSLQVEAYRAFGFSPANTLEMAQTLYEGTLISYPRTSSQKLPSKLNIPSIVKKLADNPAYKELAGKAISNGWFKPLEGKKEDPAHPAIHPTGQKANGLGGPEAKLYDLIVRRFLATLAPPAKKERTAVTVDSKGQKYAASGVVTKEKGWIEFYAGYYESDDQELPPFAEGEKVALDKKKKTKKETKPPRRYTDASIISELEKRHLGTKATRANIVETLHKRGYVSGKSIQASDFGIKVVEVLEKYAPEILDENLTRKIEDDMEKIQDGTMGKEEVINEGKEVLVQILDKFKAKEAQIGNDLLGALKQMEDKSNIVGPCDKCGSMLHIIRMRDGRQFIGCKNYPNCRNAYPLPGGSYVTTSEKKCEQCGKPVVGVKMNRRSFMMCVDPKCPSKADWGKKKQEKKEEPKVQP